MFIRTEFVNGTFRSLRIVKNTFLKHNTVTIYYMYFKLVNFYEFSQTLRNRTILYYEMVDFPNVLLLIALANLLIYDG